MNYELGRNKLLHNSSFIIHNLCSGLVHHWVRELTDHFDFDRYGVAGLQKHWRLACGADAVGRAGHDDGAGEERRAAAEKGDERADVENHVLGGPVLHRLAVENRLDLQSIRIRNLIFQNECWAERRESVKRLAAAPL